MVYCWAGVGQRHWGTGTLGKGPAEISSKSEVSLCDLGPCATITKGLSFLLSKMGRTSQPGGLWRGLL